MKRESQKKQIERAITTNVSDSALTWLKWPNNLVFLRGDLSKPQLNMMNEIADVLQSKIDQQLKAGKTSLFDKADFDDGQSFPVSIKMSDIAPTSLYKDIRLVAERLASMTFEIAGRDGNVRGTRIVRLFKEVFIPEDDVRTYKGKSRLQGNLVFKIDRQYADEVWQLGSYTRYLKEVSKACKSQFSIRIYMFITSQLRRGQDISRWVIGYPQLHSMLGFSTYREATKQKPEQWDITNYPKYKDFKRRVLEVAKNELNSMDPDNNIDCRFDYKEIYPVGKHRGEPASIEFTIYKTPLGKKNDECSKFARDCMAARKEMMVTFDFSKSDCDRILNLVNDESVLPVLQNKIISVHNYIDKHPKISDRKAYAYKSIYEAVYEAADFAKAEEVLENKVSETENSSFNNIQPNISPENTTPASSIQQQILTPEQTNIWHQCLSLWHDRVGEQQYETYFAFINLLTISDNSVVVSVPSKYFLELFDSDETINQAFHDGLDLFGPNLDHKVKIVQQS